jgi:hypothetical protein
LYLRNIEHCPATFAWRVERGDGQQNAGGCQGPRRPRLNGQLTMQLVRLDSQGRCPERQGQAQDAANWLPIKPQAAAEGPHTTADHVCLLGLALDRLPVDPGEVEVIARANSATLTHGFVNAYGEPPRGSVTAPFLERMERCQALEWSHQAGARHILKAASVFFATELDGQPKE